MSDPDLVTNQQEFRKVVREHAHLSKLNTLYNEFSKVQQEIAENRLLIRDENEDPDLKELAKSEIEELEEREGKLEQDIKLILLPKDPNDDKNIFWKSAPEPAVTKRPSLLEIFSECIAGLLRTLVGALKQ